MKEMFSGAPFPERVASVNAYLGALPIAAALDLGADVVLTGRCVDSALALGPLIHEFGWERGRLRPARRRAVSPVMSSNAARRRPAASSPTGGRPRDGWADMGFPDRRMRGGRRVHADEARGDRRSGLDRRPSPSRSSTRSATPPPICCPTSPATGRDVRLEARRREPRARFRRARARRRPRPTRFARPMPTAIAPRRR